MTYSFGIFKWTDTDLQEIQRKIRTTLTKYQNHHPKSCIERMSLPRKIGGRGLLDVHFLHDRQIISLREYFHSKAHTSPLIVAICKIDENHTPLKLANNKITQNSRDANQKVNVKTIHDKFLAEMNNANIDTFLV